MKEPILSVRNAAKKYRTGIIGGTTLREELQRRMERRKNHSDHFGPESDEHNGMEFYALNKISFTLHRGERLGIIGNNGAGKSTLLKLISRITTPSEGQIEINGRVASLLEVGTGFHPELTGRENIYLNGAILGMQKTEIDQKIENIIDFSECRPFIDTPIKRYSSGMRVKLGFSVAAHLDSEILIMDEVLAVGDMAFQSKCLEKMMELSQNENKTILYVSHNMNTIRQLCSRAIVLRKGEMIHDGDVGEGISLYLDDSGKKDAVHIFLPPEVHFGESCSYDVKMKEIRLLDKVSPIYGEDEEIRFSVKFDVFCPLKRVKFRMTLRSRMDENIGTTWSEEMSLQKGLEQEIIFRFASNIIPCGVVFPCIGFYEVKDSGKYKMLDHVNRAFKIQIEQADKPGNPEWSPSYWGFVRLPDLKSEFVKQ